jgi:O-antigen ligase
MLNLGFVSDAARMEMGLNVDLHGGYVRFGANNIASLFFLIGYLIAFKCFNSGGRDRAGTLALLVALAVAILSGRRALWLTICMLPTVIYLVAALSGTTGRLSVTGRRLLVAYAIGIVAVASVLVAVSSTTDWEFLAYLQAAFSEEDERTIQAVYLIEAFKEHPLLGSGFGGYAGYTRNAEMPWLYELTYYQLLFNLGLAGTAMLFAGLSYFFHLALNTLKRAGSSLPASCGILVGFFAILVGSYSNPYLQFFDSMIFIMLFVSVSGAAGPIVHLRRGAWPQIATSP